MKLPVVDRIHPQSNRFATGVENKSTGDSKLNDTQEMVIYILGDFRCFGFSYRPLSSPVVAKPVINTVTKPSPDVFQNYMYV